MLSTIRYLVSAKFTFPPGMMPSIWVIISGDKSLLNSSDGVKVEGFRKEQRPKSVIF